jgi:SPW repeat
VRLDRVTCHRAVDIAMLMCVAGLAVATWAAMSHAGRMSAWQPCFGISATIFLALAALTPHVPWAATVRLAMSGWIILAPWLLAFADLPLARWSHLITGTLIAALSAPHLLYRAALTASDDASCA